MKKIQERFNRMILLEMGYNIIFAILGLIIILKSEMANSIVGTLIGVFFFITGIIQIFTFIEKNKIEVFKMNLFCGILNMLLGIFIMFNPLTLIDILNIGLGIGLLIEGINKSILFIKLKKYGESSSKVFLMSAVLLLFLGIIVIINPFRSILITRTIGIFIILYNIVVINDLVLLKRRGKNILKLLK